MEDGDEQISFGEGGKRNRLDSDDNPTTAKKPQKKHSVRDQAAGPTGGRPGRVGGTANDYRRDLTDDENDEDNSSDNMTNEGEISGSDNMEEPDDDNIRRADSKPQVNVGLSNV